MPKAKQPKRKTPASKPTQPKKTKPRAARATVAYSADYREYLQRYKMAGDDRPLLDPKEFDRLDDEYLDLLDMELEFGLDDDQVIRLRELEYLLLETEE